MSDYPNKFDDDNNLYLVKDALWLNLAEDYYPGHGAITVEGKTDKFPPNGIITLVDQCSAVHERAISFSYSGRKDNQFFGLELLSDRASFKPKKLTKVTMQVMSNHREALKDSIIAIEEFLGEKHATEDSPRGKTIFGRLNFLKKIMFTPKAWFVSNVTTGAAPFTVNFTFAGTGNVGPVGFIHYIWKFGEDVIETVQPNIEKTFLNVGTYNVSLTVKNAYGEDTVTFQDMIKVKGKPPEPATVNFIPQPYQILKDGKLRTPVNMPVHVEVPKKTTVDNKKTLAGEVIENNKIVDPIKKYTWKLSDNVPHSNTTKTKALYSIGGVHDLVLRTDTELGSYRVTVVPNAIDVVEPRNLWLWDIKNKQIKSYEFGLVSEVFKTSSHSHDIVIDDSFVSSERANFEFWKNNGMASKADAKSGYGSNSLIYWASGRKPDESANIEKINSCEYNGFADTYTSKGSIASRPWNWVSFVDNNNVYFILGNTPEGPYPTLSMTNQSKHTCNLDDYKSSSEDVSYTKYLSGAVDLMKHPGVFDENFKAEHGHFASYRATWKNSTGYLLRNSELGESFNLQNFYKTTGTLGMPFQNIMKLPDMPGNGNIDGELVALNSGIYFFSSYGSTYCFNDSSGIWEIVTPHNRVAKNKLDKLLATSDKDTKAYVTIDGGTFFKFNETNMTCNTLIGSPVNKEWLLSIY
jgi:PKD repeat protein